MEETEKDLKFVDFETHFKEELNSWQDIEKENGENGLDRFVVVAGTKLGDLIEYMTNEMKINSKIVLDDNNVIGFVCYDIKGKNKTAHIEIVGTNPKFRKLGYAKRILLGIKDLIKETYGIKTVTLSVNKNNMAGIKSFSKFAKENKNLDSENYTGFEL